MKKLHIGTNDYFEVRTEQYPAEVSGNFTVLYLSDLHFKSYSGPFVAKMIARIADLDPDIILLGGDYVDYEKELVHLDTLLQALSHRKNVFAIAGNHDHSFGVRTIKKMVETNGIVWIERGTALLTVNDTRIQIDGVVPAHRADEVDFSILCLHHPTDISRYKVKYNLAFAGHLHGGQFVFWQNSKGLYPGRFLFKWNMLKKEIAHCHFYISRGLGGRVPVRFNCAKEMVLVEVKATGSYNN